MTQQGGGRGSPGTAVSGRGGMAWPPPNFSNHVRLWPHVSSLDGYRSVRGRRLRTGPKVGERPRKYLAPVPIWWEHGEKGGSADSGSSPSQCRWWGRVPELCQLPRDVPWIRPKRKEVSGRDSVRKSFSGLRAHDRRSPPRTGGWRPPWKLRFRWEPSGLSRCEAHLPLLP